MLIIKYPVDYNGVLKKQISFVILIYGRLPIIY